MAISDNGYVSNYWYDAAGERTVKQSGGSEGVFVNGVFSGGSTKSGKFIAYISPYMVVSNGGNYSKHIYMGSQRIVSKLSNSGIFEDSPVTVTQQQARYALQTSKLKERFDSLGVVYNGTAQTGGLISATPASTASSYFYHPDHLGSSSLITDGTGALTQHIQYVPFGEVFVEERTNSWSTPYKFNGKELDEETGLYYYHARYYDPRLSVWLSVDPLAEKNVGSTAYAYCANSPVRYIDPTGMDTVPNKEIWGYDLIRYRTDGLDGSSDVFDKNSSFLPMPATKRERSAGINYYEIREITDGENMGNYLATANYGYTNDGIKIYEDKYIIGKDRIGDFRNGDRESGYLAGLVRLCIDGGMSGRVSFFENAATYLKGQYDPLNVLFSITTNPYNLLDYFAIVKTQQRSVVKSTIQAAEKSQQTIRPANINQSSPLNLGSRNNPLKGRQIYKKLKDAR